MMLVVDSIETAYGPSQVLFGASLEVKAGEVVTLMGRNGMGKTTTVRSIMGLTPPKAGRVCFDGREVQKSPPFKIARLGLGLVPEGRQIFPTLQVRENLLATARKTGNGREGWSLERVYDLFPRLKERASQMGNSLSGGEQQMLAVGRALMTNPKLLILDEATEGLAPLIRDEIWGCLEALKAEKQSILVIDKNIDALAKISDRHFIMEKGQIAWSGTSSDLLADPELGHRYLGV